MGIVLRILSVTIWEELRGWCYMYCYCFINIIFQSLDWHAKCYPLCMPLNRITHTPCYAAAV